MVMGGVVLRCRCLEAHIPVPFLIGFDSQEKVQSLSFEVLYVFFYSLSISSSMFTSSSIHPPFPSPPPLPQVYLPDKDCVVWSIKQFNGSREYLMRAHFGLPSISAEEPEHWRAPIEVMTMQYMYISSSSSFSFFAL